VPAWSQAVAWAQRAVAPLRAGVSSDVTELRAALRAVRAADPTGRLLEELEAAHLQFLERDADPANAGAQPEPQRIPQEAADAIYAADKGIAAARQAVAALGTDPAGRARAVALVKLVEQVEVARDRIHRLRDEPAPTLVKLARLTQQLRVQTAGLDDLLSGATETPSAARRRPRVTAAGLADVVHLLREAVEAALAGGGPVVIDIMMLEQVIGGLAGLPAGAMDEAERLALLNAVGQVRAEFGRADRPAGQVLVSVLTAAEQLLTGQRPDVPVHPVAPGHALAGVLEQLIGSLSSAGPDPTATTGSGDQRADQEEAGAAEGARPAVLARVRVLAEQVGAALREDRRLAVDPDRVEDIVTALEGLRLDPVGRLALAGAIGALEMVLTQGVDLRRGNPLILRQLHRGLALANELLSGEPLEALPAEPSYIGAEFRPDPAAVRGRATAADRAAAAARGRVAGLRAVEGDAGSPDAGRAGQLADAVEAAAGRLAGLAGELIGAVQAAAGADDALAAWVAAEGVAGRLAEQAAVVQALTAAADAVVAAGRARAGLAGLAAVDGLDGAEQAVVGQLANVGQVQLGLVGPVVDALLAAVAAGQPAAELVQQLAGPTAVLAGVAVAAGSVAELPAARGQVRRWPAEVAARGGATAAAVAERVRAAGAQIEAVGSAAVALAQALAGYAGQAGQVEDIDAQAQALHGQARPALMRALDALTGAAICRPADLVLAADPYTVTVGQTTVTLTEAEYRLLTELARNAERLNPGPDLQQVLNLRSETELAQLVDVTRDKLRQLGPGWANLLARRDALAMWDALTAVGRERRPGGRRQRTPRAPAPIALYALSTAETMGPAAYYPNLSAISLHGGRLKVLTGSETDVVRYMIGHPDQLLTDQETARRIHGTEVDDPRRVLGQTLRTLRIKVLGLRALIVSRLGQGHVFFHRGLSRPTAERGDLAYYATAGKVFVRGDPTARDVADYRGEVLRLLLSDDRVFTVEEIMEVLGTRDRKYAIHVISELRRIIADSDPPSLILTIETDEQGLVGYRIGAASADGPQPVPAPSEPPVPLRVERWDRDSRMVTIGVRTYKLSPREADLFDYLYDERRRNRWHSFGQIIGGAQWTAARYRGTVRTTPTEAALTQAIAKLRERIDPEHRLLVGARERGFMLYDPDTDAVALSADNRPLEYRGLQILQSEHVRYGDGQAVLPDPSEYDLLVALVRHATLPAGADDPTADRRVVTATRTHHAEGLVLRLEGADFLGEIVAVRDEQAGVFRYELVLGSDDSPPTAPVEPSGVSPSSDDQGDARPSPPAQQGGAASTEDSSPTGTVPQDQRADQGRVDAAVGARPAVAGAPELLARVRVLAGRVGVAVREDRWLAVDPDRVEEIVTALEGLPLEGLPQGAAGRLACEAAIGVLEMVLEQGADLRRGNPLILRLLYEGLAPVNDLLGGDPLASVMPEGTPAYLAAQYQRPNPATVRAQATAAEQAATAARGRVAGLRAVAGDAESPDRDRAGQLANLIEAAAGRLEQLDAQLNEALARAIEARDEGDAWADAEELVRRLAAQTATAEALTAAVDAVLAAAGARAGLAGLAAIDWLDGAEQATVGQLAAAGQAQLGQVGPVVDQLLAAVAAGQPPVAVLERLAGRLAGHATVLAGVAVAAVSIAELPAAHGQIRQWPAEVAERGSATAQTAAARVQAAGAQIEAVAQAAAGLVDVLAGYSGQAGQVEDIDRQTQALHLEQRPALMRALDRLTGATVCQPADLTLTADQDHGVYTVAVGDGRPVELTRDQYLLLDQLSRQADRMNPGPYLQQVLNLRTATELATLVEATRARLELLGPGWADMLVGHEADLAAQDAVRAPDATGLAIRPWRRQKAPLRPVIRYGLSTVETMGPASFYPNLSAMSLYGDEPKPLTGQEADLMRYVIGHPDQLLTDQDMARRIRGTEVTDPGEVVAGTLKRLRETFLDLDALVISRKAQGHVFFHRDFATVTKQKGELTYYAAGGCVFVHGNPTRRPVAPRLARVLLELLTREGTVTAKDILLAEADDEARARLTAAVKITFGSVDTWQLTRQEKKRAHRAITDLRRIVDDAEPYTRILTVEASGHDPGGYRISAEPAAGPQPVLASSARPVAPMRVDDWNKNSRALTIDGTTHTLSPREADLVDFLLRQRPNQWCNVDHIVREAEWTTIFRKGEPLPPVTAGAVTSIIKTLRRKLDPERRLLVGSTDRGYMVYNAAADAVAVSIDQTPLEYRGLRILQSEHVQYRHGRVVLPDPSEYEFLVALVRHATLPTGSVDPTAEQRVVSRDTDIVADRLRTDLKNAGFRGRVEAVPDERLGVSRYELVVESDDSPPPAPVEPSGGSPSSDDQGDARPLPEEHTNVASTGVASQGNGSQPVGVQAGAAGTVGVVERLVGLLSGASTHWSAAGSGDRRAEQGRVGAAVGARLGVVAGARELLARVRGLAEQVGAAVREDRWLAVDPDRVEEIVTALEGLPLEGLGLDPVGRVEREAAIGVLEMVLEQGADLRRGNPLMLRLLYGGLAPVNELLGGEPLASVTPEGMPAYLAAQVIRPDPAAVRAQAGVAGEAAAAARGRVAELRTTARDAAVPAPVQARATELATQLDRAAGRLEGLGTELLDVLGQAEAAVDDDALWGRVAGLADRVAATTDAVLAATEATRTAAAARAGTADLRAAAAAVQATGDGQRRPMIQVAIQLQPLAEPLERAAQALAEAAAVEATTPARLIELTQRLRAGLGTAGPFVDRAAAVAAAARAVVAARDAEGQLRLVVTAGIAAEQRAAVNAIVAETNRRQRALTQVNRALAQALANPRARPEQVIRLHTRVVELTEAAQALAGAADAVARAARATDAATGAETQWLADTEAAGDTEQQQSPGRREFGIRLGVETDTRGARVLELIEAIVAAARAGETERMALLVAELRTVTAALAAVHDAAAAAAAAVRATPPGAVMARLREAAGLGVAGAAELVAAVERHAPRLEELTLRLATAIGDGDVARIGGLVTDLQAATGELVLAAPQAAVRAALHALAARRATAAVAAAQALAAVVDDVGAGLAALAGRAAPDPQPVRQLARTVADLAAELDRALARTPAAPDEEVQELADRLARETALLDRRTTQLTNRLGVLQRAAVTRAEADATAAVDALDEAAELRVGVLAGAAEITAVRTRAGQLRERAAELGQATGAGIRAALDALTRARQALEAARTALDVAIARARLAPLPALATQIQETLRALQVLGVTPDAVPPAEITELVARAGELIAGPGAVPPATLVEEAVRLTQRLHELDLEVRRHEAAVRAQYERPMADALAAHARALQVVGTGTAEAQELETALAALRTRVGQVELGHPQLRDPGRLTVAQAQDIGQATAALRTDFDAFHATVDRVTALPRANARLAAVDREVEQRALQVAVAMAALPPGDPRRAALQQALAAVTDHAGTLAQTQQPVADVQALDGLLHTVDGLLAQVTAFPPGIQAVWDRMGGEVLAGTPPSPQSPALDEEYTRALAAATDRTALEQAMREYAAAYQRSEAETRLPLRLDPPFTPAQLATFVAVGQELAGPYAQLRALIDGAPPPAAVVHPVTAARREPLARLMVALHGIAPDGRLLGLALDLVPPATRNACRAEARHRGDALRTTAARNNQPTPARAVFFEAYPELAWALNWNIADADLLPLVRDVLDPAATTVTGQHLTTINALCQAAGRRGSHEWTDLVVLQREFAFRQLALDDAAVARLDRLFRIGDGASQWAPVLDAVALRQQLHRQPIADLTGHVVRLAQAIGAARDAAEAAATTLVVPPQLLDDIEQACRQLPADPGRDALVAELRRRAAALPGGRADADPGPLLNTLARLAFGADAVDLGGQALALAQALGAAAAAAARTGAMTVPQHLLVDLVRAHGRLPADPGRAALIAELVERAATLDRAAPDLTPLLDLLTRLTAGTWPPPTVHGLDAATELVGLRDAARLARGLGELPAGRLRLADLLALIRRTVNLDARRVTPGDVARLIRAIIDTRGRLLRLRRRVTVAALEHHCRLAARRPGGADSRANRRTERNTLTPIVQRAIDERLRTATNAGDTAAVLDALTAANATTRDVRTLVRIRRSYHDPRQRGFTDLAAYRGMALEFLGTTRVTEAEIAQLVELCRRAREARGPGIHLPLRRRDLATVAVRRWAPRIPPPARTPAQEQANRSVPRNGYFMGFAQPDGVQRVVDLVNGIVPGLDPGIVEATLLDALTPGFRQSLDEGVQLTFDDGERRFGVKVYLDPATPWIPDEPPKGAPKPKPFVGKAENRINVFDGETVVERAELARNAAAGPYVRWGILPANGDIVRTSGQVMYGRQSARGQSMTRTTSNGVAAYIKNNDNLTPVKFDTTVRAVVTDLNTGLCREVTLADDGGQPLTMTAKLYTAQSLAPKTPGPGQTHTFTSNGELPIWERHRIVQAVEFANRLRDQVKSVLGNETYQSWRAEIEQFLSNEALSHQVADAHRQGLAFHQRYVPRLRLRRGNEWLSLSLEADAVSCRQMGVESKQSIADMVTYRSVDTQLSENRQSGWRAYFNNIWRFWDNILLVGGLLGVTRTSGRQHTGREWDYKTTTDRSQANTQVVELVSNYRARVQWGTDGGPAHTDVAVVNDGAAQVQMHTDDVQHIFPTTEPVTPVATSQPVPTRVWWTPEAGSDFGVGYGTVRKIDGLEAVYNAIVPELVRRGLLPAEAIGTYPTPWDTLQALSPELVELNRRGIQYENWYSVVQALSNRAVLAQVDNLMAGGPGQPGMFVVLKANQPGPAVVVGLSGRIEGARNYVKTERVTTPVAIHTSFREVGARDFTATTWDGRGILGHTGGGDVALHDDPVGATVQGTTSRTKTKTTGVAASVAEIDYERASEAVSFYDLGAKLTVTLLNDRGNVDFEAEVDGSVHMGQPDEVSAAGYEIDQLGPNGTAQPAAGQPDRSPLLDLPLRGVVAVGGLRELRRLVARRFGGTLAHWVEAAYAISVDSFRSNRPRIMAAGANFLFGRFIWKAKPVGRVRILGQAKVYQEAIQEVQKGLLTQEDIQTITMFRGTAGRHIGAATDYDGGDVQLGRGKRRSKGKSFSSGAYRAPIGPDTMYLVETDLDHEVQVRGKRPVEHRGKLYLWVPKSEVDRLVRQANKDGTDHGFDDPRGLLPTGQPAKQVRRQAPIAVNRGHIGAAVIETGVGTDRPLVQRLEQVATAMGGDQLRSQLAPVVNGLEVQLRQLVDGGRMWELNADGKAYQVTITATPVGEPVHTGGNTATNARLYIRGNEISNEEASKLGIWGISGDTAPPIQDIANPLAPQVTLDAYGSQTMSGTSTSAQSEQAREWKMGMEGVRPMGGLEHFEVEYEYDVTIQEVGGRPERFTVRDKTVVKVPASGCAPEGTPRHTLAGVRAPTMIPVRGGAVIGAYGMGEIAKAALELGAKRKRIGSLKEPAGATGRGHAGVLTPESYTKYVRDLLNKPAPLTGISSGAGQLELPEGTTISVRMTDFVEGYYIPTGEHEEYNHRILNFGPARSTADRLAYQATGTGRVQLQNLPNLHFGARVTAGVDHLSVQGTGEGLQTEARAWKRDQEGQFTMVYLNTKIVISNKHGTREVDGAIEVALTAAGAREMGIPEAELKKIAAATLTQEEAAKEVLQAQPNLAGLNRPDLITAADEAEYAILNLPTLAEAQQMVVDAYALLDFQPEDGNGPRNAIRAALENYERATSLLTAPGMPTPEQRRTGQMTPAQARAIVNAAAESLTTYENLLGELLKVPSLRGPA
jgi:DNA-binding response OmpR family regulator